VEYYFRLVLVGLIQNLMLVKSEIFVMLYNYRSNGTCFMLTYDQFAVIVINECSIADASIAYILHSKQYEKW